LKAVATDVMYEQCTLAHFARVYQYIFTCRCTSCTRSSKQSTLTAFWLCPPAINRMQLKTQKVANFWWHVHIV
jgi:hypothetical protein